MKQWIKDNYLNYSYRQLESMTNYSKEEIKKMLKDELSIESINNEEKEFILENKNKMSAKEIARSLNKSISKVKSCIKNNNNKRKVTPHFGNFQKQDSSNNTTHGLKSTRIPPEQKRKL